MRVADDRAGRPINIAQQQIRRLPAHTRQAQQFVHRSRDFPAVFVPQHPAGQHDIFRLVLVEPAGVDIALDLGHVCLRECVQRRIAREERRRDQIDPRVRTLRRQAHRDHQLVILPVMQRAERVRVFLLQRGNDTGHTFRCFHICSSLAFFVLLYHKRAGKGTARL